MQSLSPEAHPTTAATCFAPTGIEGWLATFAKAHFAALPEADREAALQRVVARLRPVLQDPRTGWTADYVRLRVVALRPAP